MSIELAVKSHCERWMTPSFYIGDIDKSVDKPAPSIFRDYLFDGADIITDKERLFWRELQKKHPNIMPTDVCPCEEGDYAASTEGWEEKWMSFAYWWKGVNVDCDFTQMLKPGEDPFTSKTFKQALNEYFMSLKVEVDDGFDMKENLWSNQMFVDGAVTVHPQSGKPFEIQFKRDSKLETTLDADCCWKHDPKKDGEATHMPLRDIDHKDLALWKCNKGITDNIFMNSTTCEWFKMGKDVQECLKSYNPRLFVPNLLQAGNLEPELNFDGAKEVFRIGQGRTIRIWCVEECFNFCDPTTGRDVEVPVLKDGCVMGVNKSATPRNTFGGRWAYGRIRNFHMSIDRAKRFNHQHIPDHGKNIKWHQESAPVPLVTCPDASWKMWVCPPEKGAK